jgi:hypothetical protein
MKSLLNVYIFETMLQKTKINIYIFCKSFAIKEMAGFTQDHRYQYVLCGVLK